MLAPIATSRSRQLSRGEFQEFVLTWAGRIGVQPRRIQVQPMSRKWASCSTNGTLSFADDLLREEAAFREYVVVHEILHLIAPNHGKLFRSLLRTYLPHDTRSSASCGSTRERITRKKRY
jgi:predicted metal-dependent hydrolase